MADCPAFYSVLCEKKHKFEKFIISVRLNACPDYVDERSPRKSQ